MKKVTKDFTNIPLSLSTQLCDSKIAISLNEKKNHKFSGNIYANESVKIVLSEIYNNKCAFCENDTTAGASLQVEHYRPKAKVTEDSTHPGYYWLGYQWTNLLFACSKCNRSKANFFPVLEDGIRVVNPPVFGNGKLNRDNCKSDNIDYLNEKPLIINPELIDPRSHILFLSNGKISHKTEEGKVTIDKCKLYRTPLVIARKKIISGVLFELKKVIKAHRFEGATEETVEYIVKNEVSKLLKSINDNEAFSEVSRTALQKFDQFFINRFQPNDQALLSKIYNDIQSH